METSFLGVVSFIFVLVLIAILPLKVVNGLILQHVTPSADKELVLAFSLVGALVSSLEPILIELSQKGPNLGLLEVVLLEDIYDSFLGGVISGTGRMNLEGLATRHPRKDVVVSAFFGVLQHVVESLRKHGNPFLSLVAILTA